MPTMAMRRDPGPAADWLTAAAGPPMATRADCGERPAPGPASMRALAAFQAGDDLAVRVQEVEVGDRRAVRRRSTPSDDADAVGRESAAILAIAGDVAGQAGRPVLLQAPQDHHLETAVEDQRVGEPAAAAAAAAASRTAAARTAPGDDAAGRRSPRRARCLASGPWNSTIAVDLLRRDSGYEQAATSRPRRRGRRQVAASTTSARACSTSRPSARRPRSSTGATIKAIAA